MQLIILLLLLLLLVCVHEYVLWDRTVHSFRFRFRAVRATRGTRGRHGDVDLTAPQREVKAGRPVRYLLGGEGGGGGGGEGGGVGGGGEPAALALR